MTTAVPALLLAVAVGVWPAGIARRRLRALRPARGSPGAIRFAVPAALAPVIVAVPAWPVLGAAGAVSALVLTALIRSAAGKRKADRAALTALDGLAESLRAMVTELRAGATPVAAAESAAADAPQQVAAILRSAVAAARLGGQADIPSPGTPVDTAGAQVVRAWHLATHHGLPLADVLDAVRLDLEQRVRLARRVDARMAGPRASAGVLACLPVVALLLGHATGAEPMTVLSETAVGQLLLLSGTTFAAAGLRWTDHITRT